MLINKRIPYKFIFSKIKFDFLAISVFSIVIAYVGENYTLVKIPIAAPTILGTAISLLLAFRTAQAYDRWWEARIIWGAIVNNSRTLIREVQTFVQCSDEEYQQIVQYFVRRQYAWCYVLGDKLRTKDITNTVKQHLTEAEAEEILAHDNPANAILDLHSRVIRSLFQSGYINQFQQIQLDSTISKLCDSMGMCERIKNTVFPKTYSTKLHLLIYVFAGMIPFSLTDYPPMVEESLSILLSSAFFLIEKTAIYIQDPFESKPTDTSVTAIARAIEINLKQMIGEETVPEHIEAGEFYIM